MNPEMVVPGVTGQRRRTLLDAVDELTKPRVVANWQGTKIVRRTDPPLLDWLEEAIASNLGGSGAGKAARERVPLDLGAVQLRDRIASIARTWLEDLGGKAGRDVTAGQMLRTWYVLHSAQPWAAAIDDGYRDALDGFASQIRDKLDPPNRIEITAPCPVCGQEFVNVGLRLEDGSDDPDDVERVRVLNAVERDRLEDSYALCSACKAVWVGVSRMRELRIAIDDAEAARQKRKNDE